MSLIANSKVYQSNQSVAERLTANQEESSKGEEFNSVLKMIDSAKPDLYQ